MSRFSPRQKLALHSQFADYLAGKPIVPINVEISPSGICQASCAFCQYANGGLHRKVWLETNRLIRLVNECAEMGVKSISWTGGGEPTLHPHFSNAVDEAAKVGVQQGLFTNALKFPAYHPEQLEWIRVTMTDKPYKPECIQPLRAAKTLGFAFNYAGSQDDAYLADTLKLAESVGADYVQLRPALKPGGATTAIVPPVSLHHPLLQVTRYKFLEARFKHGYSQCEGYHFVPFVWENGDVAVCSYMRNEGPGYVLGNLYQTPFREIMANAPPHVPVMERCQVCCKNHEINRAVHESRTLDDINFP